MEVRSTETLGGAFTKSHTDKAQPALFKITMRKKEIEIDRDQNLIGLILEGLPLTQGQSKLLCV